MKPCPSIFAAFALAAPAFAQERAPVIHSVCDISQEFSFYMDGRFHRQYLEGVGRDARNWGSLERLDLTNVNLLVLTGGDPRLPYPPAAVDHVARWVERGGAVLLMIDGGDPAQPGAVVARRLGVTVTATPAAAPLRAAARLDAERVEFRAGTTLDAGRDAEVLVRDADDRAVLVLVRVGKGRALVGSRGLFGVKPDASDPINAAWLTPLLVAVAARRPIDARRPHRSTWVEGEKELGPLTLEFHAGTAPFADAIAAEYATVRPHLVAITGVEPAAGMLKRLLILPTGGGGFSSGERIAIGAWWGDYPQQRYPMVELIAHEAGHSRVLPHAEPLWNEPIATWLGIQVGRRLGMPEAERTLERQIRLGRRHEPRFERVDPQSL